MAERRARPAGYDRAEARNAEVRARLQPLAPGERPLALRLAAALAALLAVANLVLFVSGAEVDGARPSPVAALLFFALLAGAAAGLWQRRYWAVLGFEALLGVTIVWAALSLLVASNLAAVLLCAAILVVCGPLFWTLIRIMARLQDPGRADRATG